jgi:hypothetical protein
MILYLINSNVSGDGSFCNSMLLLARVTFGILTIARTKIEGDIEIFGLKFWFSHHFRNEK